ncbi:uncharacterized protein LOC126839554 [Adelges cooleyi]|uniref:uncharacterized protein LOC126839554 n=1 Tax=Adelges cooleyi TaxID=133065 RepID=UPI00217F75E5|nr:uncharacterized protein LOC126839554 [Adelges cooleyi]
MILYKSLVLFVLLNSFVRPETITGKLCSYSRYMFFVFKLHEHNIYLRPKISIENSTTLEELKMYSDSLRAHGQIVLAILDDLMTDNNQISYDRPEDMMGINLYLNNLSNTLLVRTYGWNKFTIPLESNGQVQIFKKEFKEANTRIIDYLMKSIKTNCTLLQKDISDSDYMSRYSGMIEKGHYKLHNLLPKDGYFGSTYRERQWNNALMKDYQDSLLEMEYLMQPILNGETYMQYKPKQILFHDVLFKNCIDLDDLYKECEHDDLELLRDVQCNVKMEDGSYPNIEVLFSIAQRVFDVNCIESFQQQVLAATAHPMLSVVGSYVSLVKHIFYTGDGKFQDVATRAELFEETISDLGDSILTTLVGFIRLGLCPERVLDHLKLTALELDKLVKYDDKKNIQLVAPELLGRIFRRYSKPMSVNKLRVSNEEEFTEVNSEKDYNNAIYALKMKADNVEKYVNGLEKHKKLYHGIIENRFFSYENMFYDQPKCDIISHNRYAYNILVESKHKVEVHHQPNYLDI